MSNTLVIRINNAGSEPHFEFFTRESGISIPDPSKMHDLLLNINKIIVLVPGEHVLLTQVTMPHMSSGRLVKALQFALEDQLTEPPSELHFALGSRLPNDE